MDTDRFVSQTPFIDITDTALAFWRQDQFEDTQASLTETITSSENISHFAFANRALVRAHLRHWDLAIDDAEKVGLRLLSHTLVLILDHHKSINIHPSVIGYIAKSVGLISKGEKAKGCRVYDLVFRHCRPNEVDFLLLIKVRIPRAVKHDCPSQSCLFKMFIQAVVLFMAGERVDALSRVGDLIAIARLKSVCYVVEARA